MEEKVEQAYLYDFYGELLNDRQRAIYEAFVFEDLSLSEIAEQENISRQGVHDYVRRVEEKLLHYEEKLRLFEKFRAAREKVERIEALTKEPEVKRLAAELLEEF